MNMTYFDAFVRAVKNAADRDGIHGDDPLFAREWIALGRCA